MTGRKASRQVTIYTEGKDTAKSLYDRWKCIPIKQIASHCNTSRFYIYYLTIVTRSR